MNDNTLSNSIAAMIQLLTDIKARLDAPQLDKAPDLSQYVKLDDLHDEVRDAMRDDDNMGRVAQAVWDDVDYRDLAREIEDHLDIDVDDKVSDWMSNNFSASDYDLATHDYVDSTIDEKLDERNEDVTKRITEAVNERLDTDAIVERVKANMGDAVRQIVREELRKILTKGLDE